MSREVQEDRPHRPLGYDLDSGSDNEGKERLADRKIQLGFMAKKQGRLEEHPAYVDQIFCTRPQGFVGQHECL